MKRAIVFIAILFVAVSCKNNANEPAAEKPDVKLTSLVSDAEKEEPKVILCFGNSLTAGFGLEEEDAYPAVLGSVLNSLGHNYKVINAGVSGETTSGGLNRIDWVLKKQKVDIFILELGANDGLRGVPTAETEENLVALIGKARAIYPDVQVLLAGMMVPPSMGSDYANSFQAMFPAVAERTNVALIPFFLKGVAGDPELNLPDGIHPTEEGVKIVVQNVMDELEVML